MSCTPDNQFRNGLLAIQTQGPILRAAKRRSWSFHAPTSRTPFIFAHFLAKPRAMVPPVALPVHEIFLGVQLFCHFKHDFALSAQ
jgi:hypothetical protein